MWPDHGGNDDHGGGDDTADRGYDHHDGGDDINDHDWYDDVYDTGLVDDLVDHGPGEHDYGPQFDDLDARYVIVNDHDPGTLYVDVYVDIDDNDHRTPPEHIRLRWR